MKHLDFIEVSSWACTWLAASNFLGPSYIIGYRPLFTAIFEPWVTFGPVASTQALYGPRLQVQAALFGSSPAVVYTTAHYNILSIPN